VDRRDGLERRIDAASISDLAARDLDLTNVPSSGLARRTLSETVGHRLPYSLHPLVTCVDDRVAPAIF